MTAADTKTMIQKLASLVGTSYLSEQESALIQELTTKPILTQDQVDELASIYNRLYSLKV